MWQILAILDVSVLVKLTRWKELEEIVKMANPGQSVFDIAHMQGVNGHNVHRKTMQNGQCDWSRKTRAF